VLFDKSRIFTGSLNLKLLHIVRRYGPVGGMERYVWELTLSLRDMGVPVTVVCEQCHGEKPAGIQVVELGETIKRPRWIAALIFSHRVSAWFKRNPQDHVIVHSHERVNVHHVTTMHGPPFANVRDKPWWKRASIRVKVHLFLERRELDVPLKIVPNSPIIKEQLSHYYPEFIEKLTSPVVPGVMPGAIREARVVPIDGGVVGFVGKEWKRKGLPFAVEIIKELRLMRPNLTFIVLGPSDTSDAKQLFVGWSGGYKLMGWSNLARYTDFDVLLHPAITEPYGMVVTEAMGTRVPVVISDACGAKAQVTSEAGEVLSLNLTAKQWANAVDRQLRRTAQPPIFARNWSVVAEESVAIYAQIRLDK
jgi:UDP-glucose:(heptosyl)LPS alpha-1,3-glucosyltransferase